MNCKVIQRRLLGTESPDHPGAEVQAHLDQCAPCREWQSRLLQVEHQVARLPIPASTGRDAFLQTLLKPELRPQTPAVAPEPAPIQLPLPAPTLLQLPAKPARRPAPAAARWQELAWRWRYAAAGVAAGLMLIAFASWALHDTRIPVVQLPQKPAPDPLVKELVARNHDLVLAENAHDRAKILAQMSGNLAGEVQALAQVANSEEVVQQLSQLQNQVTESLKKLDDQAATVTVAVAAPADGPQRLQQLSRNRALIQTLVEGGLNLAKEEDSLTRAEKCSTVAQGLASEIHQAVATREGDRAAEMGQHLNTLLKSGVARKLRAVRQETPPESLANKQMENVRDWVTKLTRDLETELAAAAVDAQRDDMRRAYDAVHACRTEVDKAVHG
jgi:hypothetical protein